MVITASLFVVAITVVSPFVVLRVVLDLKIPVFMAVSDDSLVVTAFIWRIHGPVIIGTVVGRFFIYHHLVPCVHIVIMEPGW